MAIKRISGLSRNVLHQRFFQSIDMYMWRRRNKQTSGKAAVMAAVCRRKHGENGGEYTVT